jgi:hypothetical protein
MTKWALAMTKWALAMTNRVLAMTGALRMTGSLLRKGLDESRAYAAGQRKKSR